MPPKMPYRLALDLGTTSLGWALLRLNANQAPCAVIKAGSRIFSDGRHPKTGTSLAVARREARAMRRRRDRLLKRKARMLRALLQYGFFPAKVEERKALEILNPYALRAKGLDEQLTPAEFARALFHINQRRGFKSNRKTDQKEADSGALKSAIQKVREQIDAEDCRTVGEWLHKRDKRDQHYQRNEANTTSLPVRARYHADKVVGENGKSKLNKYYDLYIDRAMIEQEFDALWQKQAEFNPAVFTNAGRVELKDVLLHQRKLKPVKPGRCTFLPDEERAPLALPSVQGFRIYQEVNNLRILDADLQDTPLNLTQRDQVIAALEKSAKQTFTQLRKLLRLSGSSTFNLEDKKRSELKGNTTSAVLSKAEHFGKQWFEFEAELQDEIVWQLLSVESETQLIDWLQTHTGIDEERAEKIANVGLAEGYGSLSRKALALILPELRREVVTYDKAAKAAGFHHSQFEHGEVEGCTFAVERVLTETGEIKTLHLHHKLPYYGEFLQGHVGFGTGNPEDTPEKRYGKIANPTVHIGLNQVRLVVNALIRRYGHPSEVIVEVARELKQSKQQRDETQKRQADNQARNKRLRELAAGILDIAPERVKRDDIEKLILWEELNPGNAADRRCPYSGAQISQAMLLSNAVEIEHILPFARTLDDSLNNKTVSMRQANRIKGNRTPWEARQDFAAQGWLYEEILERAANMPRAKRERFAEGGYEKWLKEDKDFLARALNDTRHLSRVAFEYLKLVSPNVRVIPGQMTAMLRAKFGLNDILGLSGEKNRNDHRHHAVDACVIGVTDQGMLQRFARANASARERQLSRLVDNMPLPWDSYPQHVQRAIDAIWVSHKPDHSHEGGMHNDTAYGLQDNGNVHFHKIQDGKRVRIEESLQVISFTSPHPRHGQLPNGDPKPYKGYKGDSNYCIEIVRNEKGKWQGEVISTFQAYQVIRQHGEEKGKALLRSPTQSLSGKPLVMRLLRNDIVRLVNEQQAITARVCWIRSDTRIAFAPVHEANVDARDRSKDDPFSYLIKNASVLQKLNARRITISSIGELRDPGFKA